MGDRTRNRRSFVRTAATGIVVGTMAALAGCSDPGSENETNDSGDGGVYRVEEVDGADSGGGSPDRTSAG